MSDAVSDLARALLAGAEESGPPRRSQSAAGAALFADPIVTELKAPGGFRRNFLNQQAEAAGVPIDLRPKNWQTSLAENLKVGSFTAAQIYFAEEQRQKGQQDERKALWSGQALPQWCYQEEADATRNGDLDANAAQRWDQVANVAWKYAFWSNLVSWSFYMFYPFLAFWGSACSANGTGFATTPMVGLGIFAPVVAVTTYLEFQAIKLLFPLQVSQLGAYKFMGKEIGFTAYFIMSICLSIVGHADLMTTGNTMGQFLRTTTCPDSGMEAAWQQGWKSSRSFHAVMPSLYMLAILAWILMIPQLIFGVLHGLPRGLHNIKMLLHSDTFRITHYKSLRSSADVGAKELLAALAKSGRMNMIGLRNFDLMMMCKGRLVEHFDELTCSWVMDIEKVTASLLVFLLLQSSIQPNVQTTMLRLALSSQDGSWTSALALSVVSVCLSVLLALYNIYTYGKQMASMTELFWTLKHSNRDAYVCRVRAYAVVFTIGSLISGGLLLNAVAQLFTAIYV